MVFVPSEPGNKWADIKIQTPSSDVNYCFTGAAQSLGNAKRATSDGAFWLYWKGSKLSLIECICVVFLFARTGERRLCNFLLRVLKCLDAPCLGVTEVPLFAAPAQTAKMSSASSVTSKRSSWMSTEAPVKTYACWRLISCWLFRSLSRRKAVCSCCFGSFWSRACEMLKKSLLKQNRPVCGPVVPLTMEWMPKEKYRFSSFRRDERQHLCHRVH